MHEMSICRSLLGIVAAQARQHQVSRVLEVNVEVGALRGIVPEHLSYYFDFLKKDTVAGGAALTVAVVPGEGCCPACAARFPIADHGYTCPRCATPDAEIVAGLELRVKTMKVE